MADNGSDGDKLPRPSSGGSHWTSFVAEPENEDRLVRGLHEQANPQHRLRVEHDAHTPLIDLSGEDGAGWTTIAVDRGTRRWAIGQDARRSNAAREACGRLYRT